MTVRTRKFIGTIVLVVFLCVYALVVMAISVKLPTWGVVGQTIYYAAAGLLWVIPAGLLIKWMQRPDEA
ncbi:MAG: DUF2842 domain-containing protein [Rhizobiales bacterium]|nr:DUF2842 domain-containing protein [Hyphomicrobiales bacterium]